MERNVRKPSVLWSEISVDLVSYEANGHGGNVIWSEMSVDKFSYGAKIGIYSNCPIGSKLEVIYI